MRIEPYNSDHLDAVVRLSLRAWTPVFKSIQDTMNAEIYRSFYPDGWQVSQQKAVEEVCADERTTVWVAIDADAIVGFVSAKLDSESSMGEIYMIAVDPDFQGQGVGTALTQFALSWLKEMGMSVAMVETGADPGHTSARRTYEKAGFELFPIARYFKQL